MRGGGGALNRVIGLACAVSLDVLCKLSLVTSWLCALLQFGIERAMRSPNRIEIPQCSNKKWCNAQAPCIVVLGISDAE